VRNASRARIHTRPERDHGMWQLHAGDPKTAVHSFRLPVPRVVRREHESSRPQALGTDSRSLAWWLSSAILLLNSLNARNEQACGDLKRISDLGSMTVDVS
jgi:hypothetical protein